MKYRSEISILLHGCLSGHLFAPANRNLDVPRSSSTCDDFPIGSDPIGTRARIKSRNYIELASLSEAENGASLIYDPDVCRLFR